jgi:DNA mismatch repair protein MutS
MISESIIKEYEALRKQYPEGVLLFQIGVFYKIVGTEATKWAGSLGLKLITINKPNPVENNDGEIAFCGFPTSGLDKYIGRLIRLGCEKIIICNQLKNNEGVNRRAVNQIITGRLAGQSQSPDV